MSVKKEGKAAVAERKKVKTFCRICLASCGLEVETDGKTIYRIGPDKEHLNNWKDFCSKGGSAHVMAEHPRRILQPMKRLGDRYVESTYEEAYADIAQRLNKIRREKGANAIATYLGNPGAHNQPGTIAQNGFMAGLGSKNAFYVGSVDTNNLQLVSREMYGSDMAVLIPDVDHADCFLFLGMNPAVSKMVWLDIVADGWNRILAAKAKGADLIIVDPRSTQSTRKATTHVNVKPGQDWALLLGIIKLVFDNDWEDQVDCAAASGLEDIKALSQSASLADLSARCGVSEDQLLDIARRFATAKRAVCVARTGVSQNKNGTVAEWLSHVLNLITGRTDKKGGRYFSNGVFKDSLKLLNKMAPPVKRRSRIGGHEAIAGAYPMAILADEILTPGNEQIRALFINSGNPVVSGPDGARLDRALADLDLLVAIDFFQRESHRHADWLIPGTHFLERDELYLLFSGFYDKPFIQLGQKVVEPPEGVRTEWEFYSELAVAMKIPFLGIPGLNAVIKSSSWLAGATRNKKYAFNVRWLWALMTKVATKINWKDIVNTPQGMIYGEKTYGQLKSSLKTADGKIAASPPAFVAALQQRLQSGEGLNAEDDQYPLRMISQRDNTMMNSWLVETVKRKSIIGDFVEINPLDAQRFNIANADAVCVSSKNGEINLKAMISEGVSAGTICIAHGWGSRFFDPVGGAEEQVQGVNRNLLIASDGLDELSGMPNLNGTAVAIRRAVV